MRTRGTLERGDETGQIVEVRGPCGLRIKTLDTFISFYLLGQRYTTKVDWHVHIVIPVLKNGHLTVFVFFLSKG